MSVALLGWSYPGGDQNDPVPANYRQTAPAATVNSHNVKPFQLSCLKREHIEKQHIHAPALYRRASLPFSFSSFTTNRCAERMLQSWYTYVCLRPMHIVRNSMLQPKPDSKTQNR